MGGRLTQWREHYRRGGFRARFAWWLLGFSVVNWPPAAVVCAWWAGWRFEPFEQLMLFYSLAALAFAAIAAINSAETGNGAE